MEKPDWNKIKADYIGGKSREDICTEYGVKYKTLDTRIYNEGWKDQLKEIQRNAKEKLIDKTADSLASEQAKSIKKQKQAAEFLVAKVINMMNADDATTSDITQLSAALERGFKLERQALGLRDETNLNIKGEMKSEIVRAGNVGSKEWLTEMRENGLTEKEILELIETS